MAAVGQVQPGGVLGFHIAGHTAYLALRSPIGELRDHPDLQRVERSQHMDDADALYDFLQRLQQRLREHRPDRVTLLHTRQYQGVPYSDAFRRGSLQSAIMIASRAEGIGYALVRQEDVAKRLDLPMKWKAKDLACAAAKLDATGTSHWAERSLAFAAALTFSALNEAAA